MELTIYGFLYEGLFMMGVFVVGVTLCIIKESRK
jgi:hypothetical protein